jgi:hypothetical protein
MVVTTNIIRVAEVRMLDLWLEMSQAESNLSELGSIEIGSARNSARVRYEFFFQLEFGSFKIHEQFDSAR